MKGGDGPVLTESEQNLIEELENEEEEREKDKEKEDEEKRKSSEGGVSVSQEQSVEEGRASEELNDCQDADLTDVDEVDVEGGGDDDDVEDWMDDEEVNIKKVYFGT